MSYKNKESYNKYRREVWYPKNRDRETARQRKRYIERKKWFHELKRGMRCCVCGSDDIRVIEFHHISPPEKEFVLGFTHQRFSKKRILQEISKCKPICANCHIILHYHTDKKEWNEMINRYN